MSERNSLRDAVKVARQMAYDLLETIQRIEATMDDLEKQMIPIGFLDLKDTATPGELLRGFILEHRLDKFNAAAVRAGPGCPALLRKAKVMEVALRELSAHGMIKHCGVRADGKAGRPTSDYQVLEPLKDHTASLQKAA